MQPRRASLSLSASFAMCVEIKFSPPCFLRHPPSLQWPPGWGTTGGEVTPSRGWRIIGNGKHVWLKVEESCTLLGRIRLMLRGAIKGLGKFTNYLTQASTNIGNCNCLRKSAIFLCTLRGRQQSSPCDNPLFQHPCDTRSVALVVNSLHVLPAASCGR